MDERTKELAAIAASAAVNCHPCLRYHVGLGTSAGLSQEEMREAIDVGLMVNQGAAEKTRGFADELITSAAPVGASPGGGRCC